MEENKKLKVGFLNPISREWFGMHSNKLEQVSNVADADYIIYESNGDPVPVIMKIKMMYPRNKLVFILSGDQNQHIDNECIWFSNAIPVSGLARYQTQIFVTNPAIFKFYEMNKARIYNKKIRHVNIYFKGTIWSGMRAEMYQFFQSKNIKDGCRVIENNKYWEWRLNGFRKPTQEELEDVAYETYEDMLNSKLVLCPKGNGNSSMRIIECLACGAIPVLIDDFSSPFEKSWNEVGLVFSSKKNGTGASNWNEIYGACWKLLDDEDKMEKIREKGMEYFKNVIFGDATLPDFKMYKDINTVCFGFSNAIIEKLQTIHLETKVNIY